MREESASRRASETQVRNIGVFDKRNSEREVQSRAGKYPALLPTPSLTLVPLLPFISPSSFVILLAFFRQLPSHLPPSLILPFVFLLSPEMLSFHPSLVQCPLPSTNQIYTSVSWWSLLFPIALCSLPPSPNKAALAFPHNTTPTPTP